jgi:hypothetical protein
MDFHVHYKGSWISVIEAVAIISVLPSGIRLSVNYSKNKHYKSKLSSTLVARVTNDSDLSFWRNDITNFNLNKWISATLSYT